MAPPVLTSFLLSMLTMLMHQFSASDAKLKIRRTSAAQPVLSNVPTDCLRSLKNRDFGTDVNIKHVAL